MSERLWATLTAASDLVVTPPLLQPADIFVDLAGEEFRRRLFTTEDGEGRTLCLRPDFTIPVCSEHLASGRAAPTTYAYQGKVFRKRRASGEPEFSQAGTEWIGHADEMATDARLFALAMDCAGAVGLASVVRVGDAHVFDALTAALGLSLGWRGRLGAAFGDPARLASALARLARQGPAEGFVARLAPALARVDAAQARAIVDAIIGLPTASAPGGRTDADIAERLLEQAAGGAAGHAVEVIERFLALTVPLDRATDTLSAFARREGVDLDATLAAFAARADALVAAGIDTAAITFDAAFGRRIGYYTGFVFEVADAAWPDGEVIGGGRYDKLIALLDGGRSLPGVGFSVWLDRLPEDA
ncbi:ATP phosphoribosyltransferase regulatory subunit [Acuticoccus sp.]|uniref:ATP phosphoribosyltransferase regulatory subunit n=1 Tax=Acuticoccus sp. TaxID=1904378 RepID=UPI003B51BD71